ncbi:MAG: hypothetical protein JKY65_05625 [Planctomycetes bacterium]|nr:hypothetical protein [Planctomycetota bacterium]
MKLATALGSVLAVGAIGIGATLVYQMVRSTPPLSAHVPQDTVLYLEAPNLEEALTQFRASKAKRTSSAAEPRSRSSRAGSSSPSKPRRAKARSSTSRP